MTEKQLIGFDKEDLEYVKPIVRMVKEGKLHAVFNASMSFVEETEGVDDQERDEMKAVVIDILRIACDNVLRCSTCSNSYKFRFCSNEIQGKPAIELSCNACGDFYTYRKGQKSTYFNFNVLKKVSNLKSWGRGLSIDCTFSKLKSPAVLFINDNEPKQAFLRIDLNRARTSKEVQKYWDKSKEIINGRIDEKISREKIFSTHDGRKIYIL